MPGGRFFSIHNQRKTIRVISLTEQNDRITLFAAYCALYFLSVCSRRQASWPHKTLRVCAYHCMSLKQGREKEMLCCFFSSSVADLADMLPAKYEY